MSDLSMSEPIAATTGVDAQAEGLMALYERAGYVRVSPALLQPAEPFLDLSGEDIRRRMFLTSDPEGRELCLRPDLTIPVTRHYLASAEAGDAAGFCSLGPVFRHRGGDQAAEFVQADVESFGRRDTAAADAEMLSLALDATAHYGIDAPAIRMGDVGLFSAMIEALELSPAWKRRLKKHFNQLGSLESDLDSLVRSASKERPEYQGVLTALAGSDPKAARALVTDLLSIAGITTVGGRTVGEIAERFLEQSALGAGKLPQETRAVIERFLEVTGDPDEAADALRRLAADVGLQIDAALDLFESRTGFLAARGIEVARVKFSTAFGRGLDYYTGFVFEMHDSEKRLERPLIGGGRYDGLLSRLGASEPIPAVGFAVWIERLAEIGGTP